MNELRWILLGCGVVLLLGILLWGRRARGQAATGDELATQGRVEPPMMPSASAATHAAIESVPPVANRWQDEEWTSTVADLPEIRLDQQAGFDDPLAAAPDDDAVLPPLVTDFADSPERRIRRPLPELANVKPGAIREPATARPGVNDKRKIVALRLAAEVPGSYAGTRLRIALEAQGLQHGRYGIFHRLDGNGATLLSVASMVEPGAFDLATMSDAAFAGVTLFTVLPGPQPAAQLCDDLVDCARQLEHVLGGVLQDERGAPLSEQRIADLRDEVMDFEHLLGGAPRA